MSQPTALVWGADGRLYITEQSGDVKVLTVAFGDPNTADSDSTASFYVVEAETVFLVKELPNHNDDGTEGGSNNRQVTGIDVTPQYDENGDPVIINGKPAVNIYVTSSDNRIGAGSSGSDTGLDTNSGIITRLTQTVDGWEALDLVRGLARSEENHSLNGLEVIQEFDDNGRLLSERLIVANGGNANAGAPSNNFSGQQETAYSAAILEVDLDQLKSMEIKNDDGRNYVYDIPTLNAPSRSPSEEALTDPFGGNDGFNGGKIDPNGPVQIYSAGYRNAYDVEVTEDGRVWTYDNGANNSWGGRPVGEAGDNGGNIDAEQDENYIATNLNNGDGSGSDSINTEAWNPKNLDQFHEITRSDDLAGRVLSAGQAGAATYVMAHPDFDDPLTLVYGGHPNPTRASGGEAGLLFTPKNGVEDAFLLVSEEHYDSVIDWLVTVEGESNGVSSGDLTSRVISLAPGELYYITENGEAYLTSDYTQTPSSIGGSDVLGTAGVPADIDDVVATLNAIEGNYLEGGYNDGAIDSGTGSINGLTEYTSTVFDDGETKMSGALMAVQLGGGNLIVMGRDENGVMQTASGSGGVKAAERITLTLSGSPLGLASIGDDLSAWDNQAAFRGSVWATVYSGSGTKIEILQPNNGAVPLAGSEAADPTDHDLDGINHIHDPFEYSAANGLALTPGEAIVMNFQPTEAPYPGTIGDTGLMGAALDGTTPNQDANPDQGLPGLYDIGGNIIPGANAALFQIKEVVPGTVVGPVNSVRDAMHVGVNPSSDVQRLVATTQVLNWIADNGSVEDGQLTGLMFGDGTQANFVRLVFGEVNGEAGFEVGYEINDNNYLALAQVAVPGLTDTAVTQVELYLEIDMADGFALYASYRLNSEDAFTELPLNGFTLPEGVLRDVLTGNHTISDGDSQASSGAAFGFLAETSEGAPLAPVNFENLKINGFGNEIEADSAGGVGAEGSNGIDTIIYTGTDTVLSPLDDSVENFDGSGTMADFHATGNGGDNVMIAGSGNNTFTGGGGADSFQGTLDTINGTEITDFTPDDEVVVQGASFDASDVTYQAGSAIITINNETAITFSGEGFDDFDPSTGESVFSFTSTANGTRITTVPALTAVAAISSGGPDINNVTVRDQTIDFLSDMTNAEVNGWVSGVTSKDYVNVVDIDGSVPDELHQSERSAEDAGEWGYSIPVENGEYLIDMYFAEIYHGVENSSGTGARVFDISIEDALVEDDYDIIGDVGSAATEVIKTYAVTVTDGVLNIGFDASVNQAKISGLVVWQVGGTYVPPEDVTPPEVVSIMIDQPFDNDSDILATVVVTDNAGINVDSINGDELIFTGYEPGAVSLADNDAITLSNDGKTATIQYTISPPTGSNAWENGAFKVGVAAGSFTDTTGLGIAAFETDVIIARNLEQLVKGALQRAINVGPTSNTIDNSLEGDDKNTYGGAITNDPILGIDLEADDPAYYSPSTKTGSNIDGKAGATGSNSGGVDLDGSAYHTYRDSAAGSYTATYEVPNGLYVVELHFAELYQTQGGQRQGDYTIQGELFAENFDAFIAAGGADKPTVLTKNVIVTDGKIVIDVNADNGEPGFNAIAIYQAVDSGIPIASILSIEAPESSDGQVIVTVQYTDDGNISGTQIGATDVTVSSAAGALVTPSLVAYDSASGIATYIFDAPESGWQTGTITASVAANAVLDSDNNGNSATASSVYVNYSSDGVILELDFENPGSPLEEGGFDGTLGDVVDDTVFTTVEGGELVVWTSNGDISQAAAPSANDFIKYVALGDPALETINITSRFDNPFPAALAAQELPTDIVPNYAQQGIVFGLGSQGNNELVKLVFGGNGGNGVQIWSKSAIDTVIPLASMLSNASTTLNDIASVELTLVVNKTAGTVTPIVTFFDTNENVLGGLRAEATEGFATASPEVLPPAVLSNLTDPNSTTAVGVTSTDYNDPIESFMASWDYLNVTSPDLISEPTDPTTTLAIVNAPDIIENGDDGFTTLNFGLTASDGFSGEVELTLSIDGAAVTDTLNFSDGTAILSVDVPNDDVANGTNEISVTLVAVNSTGLFEIDASAATATGSVTEDDEGSVPNPDDLDEDGVSNDDDLFPYDAANGMILAAGETFLLDFEEDTASPYEAGLTGLMGRANESNSAGAVESGTASVENGTLNIVADTGDHYTNNNSQKDAYAVGVKNPGGFIVETSFTMPDFDDQQEGLQAPLNYQAGGVAVSLSEDNLVKWIFGANGTAAFQLAHENKQVEGATPAVPGATFALPSGVVYSDIASVKLMLEIVVDTTSGEVTALTRSVLTLNNTNIIDGASGEITLTDPLASAIKDEAQGVSVGFIQTSTGGQSPDTFDISYDYLQVSSTEEATPQVLVGITDAGPVVENGDEGSTTLSFGLTASESFSGEVALDLTINGTSEPRTVVFTGGVGSLTVDVANDDQANGPEQVSVILAGTADEAFAIDPAAATATGTVAEDDVGQTVIGITDADSMVENGDEGTTTLSFGLTASEGFSGEVALSVDIDGVVEPRTVVFTGGVGSLTVDVANDDQANGPEQVSVILAGIAGEAFAIDPAAATATGTVTEDDEVAPTTPVRLQAEDFTAATNYTVENIGAADEGQGIRLQGGESGTASYVLAGAVAAGTYTVIVGYFDENDGESTAQLSIGNAQGQSFSGDWIFDNDASSGNAAQAASFRTVTFENVTVGDDATLDLASTAAPFEYARIDYIEFVPAGIVEPPAPTLIGITDADSMVENGDEGTTTLSFGLTASEGFSGEVALSVDIDGVVEPRTVVFTGGVGSLTVDVANDDQANGPEQVSVILAGIADEAFAIDPSAATATGTVTEDDEVAPTTPVRLQTEDFTTATNYTVENIGAADEGQGIRLQGGESGTASYALAGAVAAGTYTVIVGYFDENDGESTAQLSIGNAQGQSFSGDWIFDNDATSGNAAQAASFRTVTFENVTVGDDATLDLASTAAPFEYARIDYIEFVPAGIVEPPAPTLIGISNADPMVENGDEGSTTLSFGLTASEGFSGEVALDLTINGTSEPRTVVFTGGIGSLTVDVANDDQANGPEQVSVILAGIADEAFAIDPAAATATGTVTEDDDVAPTTPVRLQAEDFTTATNYTVENIGAADEGQGIRLQGGESGTASYALAGAVAAGTYTVIVGYFDENDGESTAQLSIGNAQGQSFSGDWIFDNDATSGNAAQASSFRTVTFENVTVGDDATLALSATAATLEYARIDYIEFVPAGIVEPPAPTLIGISDADPMVESGDEGATTLSFGLTASEGFSGEVALDLTINGTSEPRTVVFTGGVGSLTVDVANDDQANGPEQVSVILNGIADEAFAIDPAAATATGTVTEDDEVAPTTPVRLQAEDFTTATNYTVENIGAADEGQGIRLQGGESGTASYALAGAVAAGTYTVIVGYFDENDGESTAQLSIGNAQGQSFSGDWIFDNDATSGNAAQAASFRTVTFENVTVGDDATLALSATAATLEYARIDYIEFVPAGIVEPPAPTLIGISDADPMVESGDEGATTLSFGLTASEGFSGEVALDLTINGTSEPRTVVFTGGVGSLTVDVANDDQANGPEQVSVILAGIADEAFAIDPAAATAMGTVTEDDITSTDPATINLEFDEGETLQGLFDGVTEGSGTDTEETGTAEIINGNLVISASEGDAGGSNNANDNYYTNVSGGDGFTAELKFGNPFPSLPAQYSQLGLNISLSQDEYLKVTFGNVGGGQIEYSYELGGSQSKQTFSLPPSISFAQIADVVVAIEASVDGGMASFSGTMTFLDASGQSLGDTALPALLLPDGPLNTAITSAGEEFGVGVTQTSFGSGPVFVANYDYLRIQQQGEESTDDNDKPVATIAILQPVNTDAELTVVVTYADASGIATETLDNSDIALMLDGVPVAATISFDGFNATTGEATYAISSPAGGWNENGSYTVWVAQGAVSDASENANLVDSTPSTSFMIDFDEGSPLGGYAPGDDLDEDGTANQADEDIDGDGDANVDDVFAYDAQNGQPLADGESIRLNFEVNGTPYQNGFTGVMASSDVAFQDEDTGAGIVADNQLRVTTTSGDTGSANTPQNDYHLGIIRDGGFILESVVDNPFASAPGSYSQLGLAVSVNSNDFAKLVFGSVGQDIEFSSRDNNAETKLGADFPDGYGFGDFAKAKLVLDVSVNNVGNTMATATVTLLDASGEPLPGNASVTISGLELTGALKEAILDPAASVGVGITHTHGAAEAFTAAYDYFEVSAKEDTSTPLPVPATEIEEIFAGANLELSDSYDQGDVGSALVTVTPGGNDVQSSNYGSNSFQVQNTGDKKIAAVFFDVTTALYGDSVFDPDGKGGDATAKEWAINSAGNTGAIQPVGSSGYEHYFLPGIDPEPENSDNNGGYRGALVKFSATANGGFTNGETVGFSGDMDPNSIAGFTKSSVDTGSIPFWDVGGISGAELIGSNVYIKFTDGSTASGQLMSDGSQAGAQVLVSETPPNLVAELSVNGLSAGSQGTYGGEVPSVIVSGPAGEWVRVVMTKGHQPVTNNQDGIADTVNARLADKNFPANNAAEFQFVDVQLGASGTADVSQEFTYGDFLNDTSSFDGDDTLPLGFVASVIDNPNTSDGLGLGPVSQPIYLISNGTPVVDGDTTIPSEGYYLMEGSRLKVQFEDINGPGGVNPPGKWQFFDEADENGNQANFQGVGYYLWGDEDSEALNGPQAELTYTFVIPESAAGEFTLRVRGTRDPGGASDAQNDVWVKIDDNAEELLVSNVNAIDNSGFIKLYGNATGDFGFANFIDSTSDSVPNFPAEFVLDAGVHTITFAGRSEGFHIDFFELYQGNAPSINATNSTFILSGDTEPFVNNPLENQTIEAEDEFFFEIPDDTFRDLDGDILTYEALNIPDGVFFDAQTKTFSGSPSAGVGNYALEVQVTDEDGATATAGFDLVVVPEDQNEPDTYFVAMVESANGDIEQGSSLSSPDLEIGSYVVGIQFTVPDNINLDDSETIDSAIISWVSDRTHSANSTMTFSVENSLNGAGFGSVTNRNYLSEEEVWQATGTWQDGENITVGINLANQLNSLIAQEGLNSGDLITVKIEGTGGTRFVEAAGGDRTAPTLAITVADNASASQLSNNATLLFESNSISDMSADDEFGTLNPSSMSQEVGLVGINDESTVGSF
ncbi:malectin domain-containing carbohydrate-binding protein [Halomonas sp. 113]|uniref:malectin domain-containing carbohydrate-binding protein n=1 Tax=Halomonas sp. 113 TaxID=2768851 RepID=UPI00191A8C7A|nr:malectin domain-containing carbohydrate-binding protein [Halomonas sp. 113]